YMLLLGMPGDLFQSFDHVLQPLLVSVPRRNPEKVITLGKPAVADSSIRLRRMSKHSACSSLWANPLEKPWLGVIAQIRPSFLSIGQYPGSTSSTDFIPIRAACPASSSTAIGLKHQWITDWLTRFFPARYSPASVARLT